MPTRCSSALRDCRNVEEAVLLSTCLRTEVYGVVDRFHDAVAEVFEVLAEHSGASVEELSTHATVRFDDDVTSHLFSVTSGLESVVTGETEVVGQVRRAFERAQEEGTAGPVLSALFRHAFQTGKRVRTETGVSKGTTSFAYAAVAVARGADGAGLRDARVVVVGAGEMGRGVCRALADIPADDAPNASSWPTARPPGHVTSSGTPGRAPSRCAPPVSTRWRWSWPRLTSSCVRWRPSPTSCTRTTSPR